MRPAIRKLGTIDCDLVETNPIVFRDRLYRFEYVRQSYVHNTMENSYFRLVDHETGEATRDFAHGYHLGCAFVAHDSVYVTAVDTWDGEYVEVFVSDDLKRWEQRPVLHLPGYGMFNTSVCQVEDQFALMFEVGKPPEVAGEGFTARFAASPDMVRWDLTAAQCTYAKDRYTAPHCLRYANGYYYDFYLEAHDGYEQCVVRSRDLIHWEPSPLNPVLKASADDRRIASDKLTAAERERIATAVNINNSDIDFCQFGDHLVINYSWGDQHGVEHLAEAVYQGTEVEFLEGWFPSA
jgi:hypothetical protein